ncbi:hypothetical protein [Streptomyces sp. NPDC094144]|uniref:hypothetical protein n=1 Tax=Streptomyces sp. NPDC094144 TaxID=3366056 RepID=UPI00382E7254
MPRGRDIRIGHARCPALGQEPPAGTRARRPSVANIYRALAEREKREAYPEAVEAAHADFTGLRDADDIPYTPAEPVSGVRMTR